MAKYDVLIQRLAPNLILFFKRYIDDIFMIWTGTEEEFLAFFKQLNEMHPTIKFTYSYNPKTRSTTFLDTTVTLNDMKYWSQKTSQNGSIHSIDKMSM